MEECFVCGSEVINGANGGATRDTELCCSEECSSVLRRHRTGNAVTGTLSIAEEQEGLDVSVTADEMFVLRWRLASAWALEEPAVRLSQDPTQVYLSSAGSTGPGHRLLPRDSHLGMFLVNGCTPSAVVSDGNVVATVRSSRPIPIVIPTSTIVPKQLLEATFCCQLSVCKCQSRERDALRVVPCPLSPLCKDGWCDFSRVRQRWECRSCQSYWGVGEEGLATVLDGETRCRNLAEALLVDHYTATGLRPLTKSNYEGLKKLLRSLSDAGLWFEHGLFSVACSMFVEYFLALGSTMKGAATQEAVYEKALRWSRSLLQSLYWKKGVWSEMGWVACSLISRVVIEAQRFPTLHTDTMYVSRFVAQCGWTQIDESSKRIADAVKGSALGRSFPDCEQWLLMSTDDPGDIQKDWEEYLVSAASRAVKGGGGPMAQQLLERRSR